MSDWPPGLTRRRRNKIWSQLGNWSGNIWFGAQVSSKAGQKNIINLHFILYVNFFLCPELQKFLQKEKWQSRSWRTWMRTWRRYCRSTRYSLTMAFIQISLCCLASIGQYHIRLFKKEDNSFFGSLALAPVPFPICQHSNIWLFPLPPLILYIAGKGFTFIS